MRNKVISGIIIIITVIIAYCVYFQYTKPAAFQENLYESSGIYVLSTPRNVQYLSPDYRFVSNIKLLGGSDLACGEDGKVYVAIPGNPDKIGKEIDVLKNGQFFKKIELTYSLPWIVKYNPFNKKLYVGHKGKITYQNENCISVIDTVNDVEETNIMYNFCVENIVFSPDNKMIVSASGIKGGDRRLDIFDLNNNILIKSIPLGDIELSSMVLASDGLIYGTMSMADDPILYVIDWQKDTIDKIDLEYNYPYRVYLSSQAGAEHVYVTHLNENNMKGERISLIDTKQKKVVSVISNAYCPRSIDFYQNDLIVGDWSNDKLYVLQDDTITRTLDIERPMDIVCVSKP